MKLINSVCTNLVFPGSRRDIREFRRMAEYLKGFGVQGIEFYHDGDDWEQVGGILADTGLLGVYIAVLPSKEQQRWLCNEEEDARADAVALLRGCIDQAAANGIPQLMFNSGRIGKSVEKGLDALERSIGELYAYIEQKGYALRLLMEPCDTHMEAFHLVGDYRRTLAFVRRLHARGLPLRLTMDSAHTAEEGEDFAQAVRAVKEYCSHVHFANCQIRDSKSALYGDKHLGFEYPDTEWTPETLAALFAELQRIYPGGEELRIGLEVLCRAGDPYAYFGQMWHSLPFLHSCNQGEEQRI